MTNAHRVGSLPAKKIILGLILALGTICTCGATDKKAELRTLEEANQNVSFSSALPVWPVGRELEKNLTVGFRTIFESKDTKKVILRCTGSTVYRIFLNGEFCGYGPARGPKGWYRVDELDLTRKVRSGSNAVAFEVAGYNVNSYYLLDQPSFLQAEVIVNGTVVASTLGQGKNFDSHVVSQRVQKVQRYSFQRPFSEIYSSTPNDNKWRWDPRVRLVGNGLKIQPVKALLPRRVPFCEFNIRQPLSLVSRGDFVIDPPVSRPWKDRSLEAISDQLKGYPEGDLVSIPSIELQSYRSQFTSVNSIPLLPAMVLGMTGKQFQILDFGVNLTGFIGSTIRCETPSRLVFTFDEILSNGDVDFKRLGCVNIVEYDLEPGNYEVESFEPYTLRYLKIACVSGSCSVSRPHLREYVSPLSKAVQFSASDQRLNRLFAAGLETVRQNAVDVFMDCPSRERAGWLCDSYFTSRVAHDVTGQTTIEKNQFENYLLPLNFPYLPEGMLPMCYPSDHNDGVFIPNWAMWFVVQLEEYLARSGDSKTVKALQPRLMKLLDYFKKFRNSDGLLEKLESWVFVEWSDANSYVQDVNYPTNMLYAEVLSAMGRMYSRKDLLQEAEHIRTVIRSQAFDGKFFIDNSLRKSGKLEPTTNHSEVCQYFAFYFHVATPKTYPDLWHTLVTDFGPQRKSTKAHPEVHFANAFVGNVIRLELLSQTGLTQQLLDESLAYQLYMVDRTGTLWENDGAYASCNHGFASHGGVRVLYRDFLGIHKLDTVHKTVDLRFTDLKLEHCEGSIPTPNGPVTLKWKRIGQQIFYHASAPKGYKFHVANLSSASLKQE